MVTHFSVFLPGKSHGQRSLEGYIPWGHKELDTTEHTHTHKEKTIPLASSVHRILKARILEWVAILFSRGSSQPRDRTLISSISCTGRQVLYH